MTKVVWLVSWWPNESEPSHGIFNQRWAECIKDYVELKVIVADDSLPSGIWRDIDIDGMELYRVGFTRSIKGFLSAGKSSLKILAKIRKWSPEYLHVFSPLPFGRIKPWLALNANAKLIVIDQTVTSLEDLANTGRADAYRSTFRAAQIVHVTNLEIAEKQKEVGLLNPLHKVKVVSNIVPGADIAYQKESHTKQDDKPFIFIHISGLRDHQKNVSGIIRAFAKTVKQHSKARLWIGGDGPDFNKLVSLVVELNLDDYVTFLGELNQVEVIEYLRKSDSLVMFSRRETDSVVSLEALTTNLPLILSDFCGAKSKLNGGEFGTLVPSEDESKLTDAMCFHIQKDWREAKGAHVFVREIAGTAAVRARFLALYEL